MYSDAMPTVDVNGVKLNYIQIGPESGEACRDLVMVHGLATNLAFWYMPHALKFSDRCRVTVYDLRGHGRSGATPSGYTPHNMSVDLLGLLDHLEIERAHFLAHSFGGIVALNLACGHSDRFRSLILVDTHISAVRRMLRTRNWAFGAKIQPVLNRYGIRINTDNPYFGFKLISEIARLHRLGITVPTELTELVSPVVGNFNNRTARQWLELMETTEAESELMGDDGLSPASLKKLKFPILAMYGEHSQAMSSGEQLLEVWPHAEFYRVRDVGHFFPVTRPREFMDTCRQFWQDGTIFHIPRRKGDAGRRYFRSDRFYRRQGKWCFDTRESSGEGFFESLEDAMTGLRSRIPSVNRSEQRL